MFTITEIYSDLNICIESYRLNQKENCLEYLSSMYPAGRSVDSIIAVKLYNGTETLTISGQLWRFLSIHGEQILYLFVKKTLSIEHIVGLCAVSVNHNNCESFNLTKHTYFLNGFYVWGELGPR